MAKVIVIGGGIIGLSSAFYLQRSGWEVTILDMGDLQDNCSTGNAGMIVPSHFVPLAAPGMIKKGLSWMFNSKSPFYIRPSLDLNLFSWGLKYIKNATVRHTEFSARPLVDISLLSMQLYRDLRADLGDFGLNEKGILMLFKTEKTAEEEYKVSVKARELGLDAVDLSAAACLALQPDLNLDVLGGVHYRCDSSLNPNLLILLLTQHLVNNGVTILKNHKVTTIRKEQGLIKTIIAGGQEFTADKFVLAGGSWSSEIAKTAGLNIPVMPGKGYSFMESNHDRRIQIAALLCEAKVAVTPMADEVRFGGTMELGKMNCKIDTDRVKGIVESISTYFPDIKIAMPAEERIWFGFRPCSPDGLPFIGQSSLLKNLYIATGHGMMGLSSGPATGKLISEMVNHNKPSINCSAFSPNRYG